MFRNTDKLDVEDLIYCDGSHSNIVQSASCQVPMLHVKLVTGLSVDKLIQVKVRAHNDNGWGEFSEINVSGQTINTLPLKMAPIKIYLAEVSNTQVTIRWDQVN